MPPMNETPARTHAEASRQRRDIVSGAVMDEACLVRFVAGPEGVIYPDLGRKLPGRGLWLLTHPDLRRTARVRRFLDFMAEAMAQSRDLREGRRPQSGTPAPAEARRARRVR